MTTPSEPGQAGRLEDLERRVAALERALRERDGDKRAADAGHVQPPVAPTERFWALEGLRGRAPSPPGAVLFTGIVATAGIGPYEWQEGYRADDLLENGWEEAGTALAALASPARMLLLREVLHGRSTAAELAEVEGFGTSGQVYHHLRQLVAAGWLRTSSRGRYVVPPERVVPLLVAVAAARR